MSFLNNPLAMLWILLLTLVSASVKASDKLMPGETLSNNQYISSNGRYSLIMQSDGSLVMYRNDGTIRYRMAKYGSYAIMQSDGNFVEYAGTTALWNTGTWQSPGYWLRIYDNGDLTIEWSTSSGSFTAVQWSIGPDLYYDPTAKQYGMTKVPAVGIPPRCPYRGEYPPPPGC